MSAPIRLLAVAGIIAAATGCGDVIRQGRSSAILNVNSLQGQSGRGGPTSSVLLSDVLTLLRAPAPCTPASPCPTVFNDLGLAVLSLSMKNTTVAPTSNNQVTISRYTVEFRRVDRPTATPGIDVPFPIDGAVTATVAANGTATVAFELVRVIAKQESPLAQLLFNPNVISTIAEVTFYGKDLVGNAVSAKGSITVNFGDFADQ